MPDHFATDSKDQLYQSVKEVFKRQKPANQIIETESEKLIKQGEAKMLIELGQEDGLDDEIILERLQKKIGVSAERAEAYLEKYGKQLV